MIEVIIYAELKAHYIVYVGSIKFIVAAHDLVFIDARAYTYPEKLKPMV